MTDTLTIEPEMAKPQPRPFQFTIGSLMILTAVVGGFFAIATQVGFIYAAGYFHFVLRVLTLKYRTSWKGILALNLSLINCYLLPALLIEYFVSDYFPSSIAIFWLTSCLSSLLFAIHVADAETRFNKITGGIGLGINLVIFVIGLYLFMN